MNSTNMTCAVMEKDVLKILNPILLSIQTLLTIVNNFIIFWLVYKNPRLRSPANTIFVNLCVVDLLYIRVSIGKIHIQFASQDDMGYICCGLSASLKYLIIVTQLHLVILSIDRLLAIKFPLRYPKWFTNKCALVFSIATWAVFIGFEIQHLVRMFSNEVDDDEEKKFWKGMSHCRRESKPLKRRQIASAGHVVKFSLIYFLPLTIVVVSYSTSLWIALGQVKQIYPMTEHDMRKKSALKAARTTAILIGAYFVLYTPSFIYMVVHMLTKHKSKCPSDTNRLARAFLSYIVMTAAWINPLVYTFTNADFKNAFLNLYKRSRRTQNQKTKPKVDK